STLRPPRASSTTSPVVTPSRSAVARLTRAAFSQTSLVSGLGSSWSQPLLVNRPSQTVGSGRETTSSPPADASADAGGGAPRVACRLAPDHVRRSPRHAPLVHRDPPERPEVPPLGRPLAPGGPDDLVARAVRVLEKCRQQLDRRPAAVQGRDQRLLDRGGAVG